MRPQTMLVGLPACGRQWRQLAQVFTGWTSAVELARRAGCRRVFSGRTFAPS